MTGCLEYSRKTRVKGELEPLWRELSIVPLFESEGLKSGECVAQLKWWLGG